MAYRHSVLVAPDSYIRYYLDSENDITQSFLHERSVAVKMIFGVTNDLKQWEKY